MSSLSVLLLAFTPLPERGVNSAALQLSDSAASALCIGLAGALVAASTRGLLPLGRAAGALDVLMLAVALACAVLAGRARRPAPRSGAPATATRPGAAGRPDPVPGAGGP